MIDQFELDQIYDVSEPLVFRGHYVLVVLKGAVEVGGTVVEASPERISVSCPIAPFYSIKSTRSFTQASILPPDLAEEYAKSQSVVAVLPAEFVNLSKLAPPFKALYPPLSLVSDQPELTPFKSWKNLSSQILTGQRVVLVGPKNSGKSSFAKYLVNQRVAKHQKVYYLDLDPGQCEFSPPGTLALSLVTQFVFGPPYSHCKFDSIIKAHSLGYPSPMDTPDRYLEMCNDLYTTFLAHSADFSATLIVNTPGWTKGLGFELNSQICLTISPEYLCHMGSDEAFNDFSEIANDACDHIVSVDAVQVSDQQRFSAAELRVVQSMTYFHQLNTDHLTTWAPFEVEYGPNGVYALAVLDSDGIDLTNDLSVCVEGTIVSIDLADRVPPISELSGDIPFISPADTMVMHKDSQCVGYAVIQSMTSEYIRLLTPFDPKLIAGRSVVLTRGRLKLPLWEMWDQKSAETPWLSSKAAGGIGGSQLKFRRNLQRR